MSVDNRSIDNTVESSSSGVLKTSKEEEGTLKKKKLLSNAEVEAMCTKMQSMWKHAADSENWKVYNDDFPKFFETVLKATKYFIYVKNVKDVPTTLAQSFCYEYKDENKTPTKIITGPLKLVAESFKDDNGVPYGKAAVAKMFANHLYPLAVKLYNGEMTIDNVKDDCKQLQQTLIGNNSTTEMSESQSENYEMFKQILEDADGANSSN